MEDSALALAISALALASVALKIAYEAVVKRNAAKNGNPHSFAAVNERIDRLRTDLSGKIDEVKIDLSQDVTRLEDTIKDFGGRVDRHYEVVNDRCSMCQQRIATIEALTK